MAPTVPYGLPIDEARERVLAAVATGDPVVVAAPTGSGKSTRLPVWLAERGDVLVVEPRRVACRALAGWLAEQRGEALGQSVGYRVRFEEHRGPETRILFVTPGMALAMLAADPVGMRERWRTLLLDEFHERSWEVDLIAALARAGRFGDVSLCLCSATLDTDALVATLGARLVTSSGRTFPVDIEYSGDAAPTGRDLESRVRASVEAMLARTEGDVLVFLPGKAEIERCRAVVSAAAVPVHGGMPPRELTAAFAPSSTRRVFLATNVAETSLTIPSVTAVVDSGLVRMRVHQGGRAVLAVVPISAASADQRAGRAGRVGPGRCARLWSARFEPEPTTPPEIGRIELDDVLLRAAICGLPPAAIEGAPWVTAPPGFAVADARKRLAALGAVDAAGQITSLGRAQATLPVGWLGARILADAPAALLPALAEIVALIEHGRPLPAEGSPPDAVDEVDVQLHALRRGKNEARRIARQLGAKPGPFDRPAVIRHLLQRIPEAAFVPRGRKHAWGNGRCELLIRPYTIPDMDEQPPPPEAGIVLDWEWLGRGRGSQGVGRLLMRCTVEDLVAAGIGEIEAGAPTFERGRVVAPVERTHAGVTLTRRTEPLRGRRLCEAIADLLVRGAAFQALGREVLDALHRWDVLAQALDVELPPPPKDPAPHLAERLATLGVDTTEDFELVAVEDLVPPLRDRALEAGVSAREVDSLVEDFPRRFTIPGGAYRCTVKWRRKLVVVEPADGHTRREPAARFLPRFRGFAVEFRKASRVVKLR